MHHYRAPVAFYLARGKHTVFSAGLEPNYLEIYFLTVTRWVFMFQLNKMCCLNTERCFCREEWGGSESVNLKQLNASTSCELPRGAFQPSVGNLLNPCFSPENKPREVSFFSFQTLEEVLNSAVKDQVAKSTVQRRHTLLLGLLLVILKPRGIFFACVLVQL